MKKYILEVNEQQLQLINNACEYLGRHLIGQKDFKPLVLEERSENKDKLWYTLTDIRKVIMHHYAKWWNSANVHSYDVYKMGTEPLMSLKEIE